MKSCLGPLLLAALILLVPAVAPASSLSLDAPALGYVFDRQTGELRRIGGFLGASSLGAPVDLGFPIMRAVVSPDHRSAIVQDEQGRMLWVNLAVIPPAVIALEGVISADRTMFSPSGRRAALYSSTSGHLQLLEIRDGTVRLGEQIDLESIGGWAGFALSDAGTVLAASMHEAGGTLYMLRPGELPLRVSSIESLGGLEFMSGSEDAVAADAGAKQVLLLRSGSGSWQAAPVATARDLIENPLAIRVTADGRFVVLAVAGGVTSIPLAGGVAEFTPCACAPRALTPLKGGNAYLLTDDTSSPLQVVEMRESARVLFVPAIPAEVEDLFN